MSPSSSMRLGAWSLEFLVAGHQRGIGCDDAVDAPAYALEEVGIARDREHALALLIEQALENIDRFADVAHGGELAGAVDGLAGGGGVVHIDGHLELSAGDGGDRHGGQSRR